MTSDRQYRSKLNIDEAKKQLLLNSGTQFDSNVVNNFIALLEDFDEMQKEIEHTYNTNQFLEKENA